MVMVENMNQRFLERAKQAGLKFPSETALSPMEEKFAELILVDLISEFDQSMTGEEDSVDYGLHLAKVIIKERFGVE
jgi:hypothetical protein